MFGSDNQSQNPDNQAVSATDTALSASPADMPTVNIGAQPDAMTSAPSAPTIPDPMVTPSAQPDLSTEASAEVEAGTNGILAQNAYTQPAPQIGLSKPSEPVTPSPVASMIGSSDPTATPVVDPDLAQIKQQALQSLEPLIGQLDQAPDEKFKTVMMLIQASDNSKMLGSAYEAASQITDGKTRAQALLDIVNEINYFTVQAQAKQ